jgi:predicted small secreted protein
MHKFVSLFIAGLLAMLAGCNTMEGIGQDIKKAGGVLEDAAKKK